MADVVRDYLQSRNYAEHVIRGGLDGLVRNWEYVAESVAAGETQYRDDYLNDMDGRRILEEAMDVAPAEDKTVWIERVRTADKKIRLHLCPTKECLWGEDNARKYGYSRDRDWWYYLEPVRGLFD